MTSCPESRVTMKVANLAINQHFTLDDKCYIKQLETIVHGHYSIMLTNVLEEIPGETHYDSSHLELTYVLPETVID